MICKPCKQALMSTEQAVQQNEDGYRKKAIDSLLVADAFHYECRGCDCTHEIPTLP
jgi:hypothetical protein